MAPRRLETLCASVRIAHDVWEGWADYEAEALCDSACDSGHRLALAAKVGHHSMFVPNRKAKQADIRFESLAHGEAPAERVT